MRTVVPMDCDVCHSRYFNARTFCIWSKIHQVQLEMWKVSWFCCLVVFSVVVFMDFPHFALYQSREKEPAGAIGNARNFAEKFHPRGNFHRRAPGGKAEATFGKESSSCAAAAGREKATMQLGTCFPRFASRHASRCSHKVGGKVKDRCRCRSVDGEGVVTVSGNAGCWHFPTSFIMHRLAGPTPAIVRSTGTPLTFCRCKKNLDDC